MRGNSPKKLANTLAIGALLAYVAALMLPAIHEGGYYDSQLGNIEPNSLPGSACAIGLCFSAWFVGIHFLYLSANIVFVILTLLIFSSHAQYWLVRWLMMLTATVAPIHFIAFRFQYAMIGTYFWFLAFILSSMAHRLRFVSSTRSPASHLTPTAPVALGQLIRR